jgi:hypothetical protein
LWSGWRGKPDSAIQLFQYYSKEKRTSVFHRRSIRIDHKINTLCTQIYYIDIHDNTTTTTKKKKESLLNNYPHLSIVAAPAET